MQLLKNKKIPLYIAYLTFGLFFLSGMLAFNDYGSGVDEINQYNKRNGVY